MLKRTALPLVAVTIGSLLAFTGCSSGGGDSEESAVWRAATSVEDGGGMEALEAAAKAEGTFNVMGLYPDWANYGELLDTFSQKYGITVNNDTSTGSSQDLLNAVKNRQGQDNSIDYLDTGQSFATDAAADGYLAEYYPQTASDLPDSLKATDGTWFSHLGGTMAIGCDANAIENCPTSFEDLLKPEYKGKVALTSDPTTGETGLMAVFAASLANGGSLGDIQPGIDFFSDLSKNGNLVPATAESGTIETGETPIVVSWDYVLLPWGEALADSGIDLSVTVPSDAVVSSYYAASINADAPHPAVARLWQEFLFSDEGQNILLNGYVKPGRLDAMIAAGTVDETALAALPQFEGEAASPTLEQRASQSKIVAENWAKAVG